MLDCGEVGISPSGDAVLIFALVFIIGAIYFAYERRKNPYDMSLR